MEDNKVNAKKSGFLMNLLKSIGTNLNRMISYDPSLEQINNHSSYNHHEEEYLIEEPTIPLNEDVPIQINQGRATESNHKMTRTEYIKNPIMRMTNYINEEQNESPKNTCNEHNISYHTSYQKCNSMLSHKSKRKEELPQYSDVSMMTINQSAQNEINKSNISMRSLDDIKNEINTKRKENIRKIKEITDNSLFVNISDDVNRAFEEKKKILVDYYNKKAEKIKEVALILEKEKLKREDNFNHLTRTKNNSFAVKGKEKKKHLEIKKNNELFIEKVEKKKDNISFEVNKSNVTMNNSSLFDKKPAEKQSSTLLGGTSIFGNITEKEKPSESIPVQSSLFNSDNKTNTISFAAPDNKSSLLFSSQPQNTEKPERKSSTTIFANSNPSNLFSSNTQKENEPKKGLFEDNNKKEEEKKENNSSIFGNLNNNKKENETILPKKGLFESNQPPVTTNKVEAATTTNPVSSQTLKSTDSNGSLFTDSNPFLLNNITAQPPKVFSSPTKPNNTSIFGSNNQPNQSIFGNNQQQNNSSIFTSNNTTTGNLFSSNPQPVNQNKSLFGSNQPTNGTSLFQNNNPSSQSSLFGNPSTTTSTLFGNNTNQTTSTAQGSSLFPKELKFTFGK